MKPRALASMRAGLAALIVTILFSGVCAAQKKGQPAAPSDAKSHFLIRLKPARTEGAATDEEKARILLHFDYLKTLRAQGKLVLAGVSTDDYTGIVIVEAAGQMEAERIMLADPAVSGNVYLPELHPFQLALKGSAR
jgi:uncharacterized protein YciI